MRHEAIYNTHPTVVTIDDGAGCFDKDGNSVSVDETKVSAEIAKLQAEYDAQEYARKREAEYPTWNEVNEAMAEKLEGRGEKWEAVSQKRQAVRAKYPKG